ncbi:NACHT domain-containing protein [Streptomyces sp. NPDC057674]|uniref:NACHT domain-containing protein n=1 Tax=Streptomyces sp. NPDC057674 TaxID=3346203 RepID=UPI003692DF96
MWALAGREGALDLSQRTDLMAFACGAIGVVGLIATFWRRVDEDEATAAARLARAVKAIGEPQWTSSLGGDLKVIDVAFAFRPYSNARAAALPASPAGRLAKVVEDYRELRPRRMVITGSPGAGKTVLARKFVLELNRLRGEEEPVPVLVALADWDKEQRFDDWLAGHLSRDYGLPSRSAVRLVAARMVLPVLDGLDEMDPAGALGVDSRAGRALESLARYQDGTEPAPLVLTCRTQAYDTLEGEGAHILDAARLEITPVTSEQAVTFLELRGAARRPERWRPLLHELRARPTGPLARALSTPWRLTLAAVAYDREGDPAELLAYATEEQVADRLLSRFITASALNAAVGPGRYAPDRVHRGLRVLAASLGAGNTAETDLTLTRLGRLVPKWQLGLVLVALLLPVAVLETFLVLRDLSGGVLLPAVAGIVVSVRVVVRVWTGRSHDGGVTVTIPRVGSPLWRVAGIRCIRSLGRSRFGLSALLALVGLTWWLAGPGGESLVGLLLPVLAVATTVVVVGTLSEVDSTAVGPTGELRGHLWFLTLAAAAVVRLILQGAGDDALGLSLVALAGAIAVLAVQALTNFVAYLLFLLVNRRSVPFRLARFLEWSVSAGLVRTSGAAYQFRHREFQEWLVRHPVP